ncbi:MAG: RNA polymerase sigma factor, partial [Clostridia bacterium]
FEAWVMRILVNECKDVHRRNKRRPLPLNEAVAETAAAPEMFIDIGLQDALRQLPTKYRLPLLLHHMDGYSLAEISSMLHLPVGTIKGRLHQARILLKTFMEKEAEQ